jgi:hypothetical protein
MLAVTRAQYRDGYRIWVEFDNGASGVVDLSDLLWGPMFELLKDIEQFKRFTVSEVFHTLVWENGADLSPECLLEKLANTATQTPAAVSR